jgi:hypothetical protein
VFFYLHCGRGFNCLHGRWMKRCLISYFFCGNPQNNFGAHKARKNLGLEAVKWKTVAKVGVATLSSVSSDAQYLTSSLSESITFSRIWFWESRRARARFTHENSRCIEKNCSATTGVEQHNLNWKNSVFLQSTWWECLVPLLKNLYSTACLLYNKVLWPKHSILFTKCKTN